MNTVINVLMIGSVTQIGGGPTIYTVSGKKEATVFET